MAFDRSGTLKESNLGPCCLAGALCTAPQDRVAARQNAVQGLQSKPWLTPSHLTTLLLPERPCSRTGVAFDERKKWDREQEFKLQRDLTKARSQCIYKRTGHHQLV